MISKRFSIAALSAIWLTGCASFDPLVTTVTTQTPFMLSIPELNDDVQTAEPGDFVHRQHVRVAHGARLSERFQSNFEFDDADQYSIEDGTDLYEVIVSELGSTVYCAPAATPGPADLWTNPQPVTTCFLDRDRDRYFEHVYTGMGSRDWLQYTMFSLANGRPLQTSLAYEILEEPPFEPIEVAVRYETTPLEGFYFRPLATDRFGEPQPVAGALQSSRNVQRGDPFPQTVQVLSVEIEILGFDDGEITYRIKPGERGDEEVLVTID